MTQTTRKKILDTATRIFAEKGFAGCSLSGVARAAEVELPEVVALFPNESRLYEVVLETQFSLYTDRMESAFDNDELPARKVEPFAQAMYDVHRHSPCFFPLFYRELLTPSPFFETIVKRAIKHVAYLSDNNIAKGVQRGIFRRGVNPANATMVLAGMFHYYFLASRLAPSLLPEAGDDEEYFLQALKVFMEGMIEGA